MRKTIKQINKEFDTIFRDENDVNPEYPSSKEGDFQKKRRCKIYLFILTLWSRFTNIFRKKRKK